MVAGGEMMHGIGVFLLVALVPTGLTLWFLRRHRPTWSVFTVTCLAVAEAAALLEGTGDERHLALTRGSLGLACVRLGDTAAARRSLASALALASGLAAEREAAYALEAATESTHSIRIANAFRSIRLYAAARDTVRSCGVEERAQ